MFTIFESERVFRPIHPLLCLYSVGDNVAVCVFVCRDAFRAMHYFQVHQVEPGALHQAVKPNVFVHNLRKIGDKFRKGRQVTTVTPIRQAWMQGSHGSQEPRFCVCPRAMFYRRAVVVARVWWQRRTRRRALKKIAAYGVLLLRL